MRLSGRIILKLGVGVAVAMTAELIFALWSDGFAQAADVKVLSSPALKGVITEIARQFEGTTSNKLVADFEVFTVLKRRIDGGEGFDIAILSPELIDNLIKAGKIATDARVHLARQGIGLGV